MIRFLLLASLILSEGCKQRPSHLVLKEFGNGLQYEQFTDLNDGTRVVSKSDGADSSEIIVPGDVIWVESKGRFIYGQKRGQKKPVDWMPQHWDKSGYFLLDPSKIRSNASTDEEVIINAIEWFSSKEELDKRVSAITP